MLYFGTSDGIVQSCILLVPCTDDPSANSWNLWICLVHSSVLLILRYVTSSTPQKLEHLSQTQTPTLTGTRCCIHDRGNLSCDLHCSHRAGTHGRSDTSASCCCQCCGCLFHCQSSLSTSLWRAHETQCSTSRSRASRWLRQDPIKKWMRPIQTSRNRHTIRCSRLHRLFVCPDMLVFPVVKSKSDYHTRWCSETWYRTIDSASKRDGVLRRRNRWERGRSGWWSILNEKQFHIMSRIPSWVSGEVVRVSFVVVVVEVVKTVRKKVRRKFLLLRIEMTRQFPWHSMLPVSSLTHCTSESSVIVSHASSGSNLLCLSRYHCGYCDREDLMKAIQRCSCASRWRSGWLGTVTNLCSQNVDLYRECADGWRYLANGRRGSSLNQPWLGDDGLITVMKRSVSWIGLKNLYLTFLYFPLALSPAPMISSATLSILGGSDPGTHWYLVDDGCVSNSVLMREKERHYSLLKIRNALRT